MKKIDYHFRATINLIMLAAILIALFYESKKKKIKNQLENRKLLKKPCLNLPFLKNENDIKNEHYVMDRVKNSLNECEFNVGKNYHASFAEIRESNL